MFAVDPIKDCAHCFEPEFKNFSERGINDPCKDCQNCGENWTCLTCAEIFCSRYVKQHMVKHNEETSHPIALSFSDLSFWCYSCDSYVKSGRFEKVHNHFYKDKFGNLSKDDTLGIIGQMADMHLGDKDKEDGKTEEGKAQEKTEEKVPDEDKVEDDKTEGKDVEKATKAESEGETEEEEKAFSREELIQKLKNG